MNLKSQENSVKQIFNRNAFFSFLSGATKYYNAIYILFTHFVSFIGYEDVIHEVIYNLHVQGAKFSEKRTYLAENILKVEFCRVHGVNFFQVCVKEHQILSKNVKELLRMSKNVKEC